MSLWFRTRDKYGTVRHVAVPFDPFVFIAMVGICVALLLPFIQMFRNAVATSPILTASAIASIVLVGAALFASAKMSIILAGRFVSFGARTMSPAMRVFYITGYVLLAIGSAGVLLFWLATFATR